MICQAVSRLMDDGQSAVRCACQIDYPWADVDVIRVTRKGISCCSNSTPAVKQPWSDLCWRLMYNGRVKCILFCCLGFCNYSVGGALWRIRDRHTVIIEKCRNIERTSIVRPLSLPCPS